MFVVTAAGTLILKSVYIGVSERGTCTHTYKWAHFQYNRKFKNRRRFESVSIDVSC